MNGLVAIVVACPCALIISTPVTYVAGLAAAAQQGVIVRGGAYLEALAAVKEIAFDKTGTLTEGVFGVLHLKVIGNRSRREVLEHIALMEASAPHPVATALVKAAAKEGVNVPKHMNAVNHTILPGEGITASVDGRAVYIGNATLFKRLGMYNDLPAPDREVIEEWTRQSGMVASFPSRARVS
jgi:Cd2+/Zn2+-exporting ATPase